MARPRKKGLSYFPFDVDFYDDFKVMKLGDKYGPLGLTVYGIILTSIYREGYYLEVSVDALVFKIIRTIGNRWIKSSDLVSEVIYYCAEIGLLHKRLLDRGIITSRGIQKRYSEATVRNKVDTSKYWLLDGDSENETAEPLSDIPENTVSVTETDVFATETPISATEMQQSKVNKNKVNKIKVDVVDSDGDSASNIVENNVETLTTINGVGRGVVMLTEAQIDSILELVGIDGFNYYVDRIASCILDKGYKIKSHYKTIIRWLKEDGAL